MKISVIIPMYNESKIIEQTAQKLSEYMDNNFDEYEIIFSDDGSSDGTVDIIKQMNLPCVRVIGYEDNRGKGSAVRNGMINATGDVKIFTDADLAYGTEVIAGAYNQLINSDADVLIGSRNMYKDGYEGYTFIRRLMSKVYIRILCVVGNFRLSDSQCGIKAFKREAADDIFPRCCVDGFAFDFEVILWAQKLDKKIVEMPVKIINHRESSIKPISDAFKMLADLKKIKKDVKSK